MRIGRNRRNSPLCLAPALPTHPVLNVVSHSLLLTRQEIARLMAPQDYLAAVEAGFRSYANGEASVPMPMHIPAGERRFSRQRRTDRARSRLRRRQAERKLSR